MVNGNPTERELFAEKGFCIAKKVFSPAKCQKLATPFADHWRAGVRDLFQRFPEIQTMVRSEPLRAIVDKLLSSEAFAVKGILFDKTPLANWLVTWHQDLSINVKEKHEVPGYGPWSEKERIIHVRPPVDILQRMITLRIHLDACQEENGPLRVVAGSHQNGVLEPEEIRRSVEEHDSNMCCAEAGDCVVISPLLLHASSKAVNLQHRHRRVLHLEFADIELPKPLQWYERW